MRGSRHRLLLAFALASPCLTAALADDDSVARAEPATGELLVMLQGDDLEAITRGVMAHGAVITHRLPIIDAVGARMNATQLAAIKASTASITRVIDDLAWEPAPDIDADQGCQLTSSIELRWRGATANWTLYNKGATPLPLVEGVLGWPQSLGKLLSMSSDGRALDFAPASGHERLASWRPSSELTLAPGAQADLSLRFEHAPTAPAALQREIELSALTSEDCKTELVPSYAAPDQDSYYPSVTGAALLHSNGITGAGVTVAIIDSGLWEGHAELALDTSKRPRVKARFDAILGKEVEEAVDESGHGTHMASVLARSGLVTRPDAPQPSYRGIAPDAGIVAIKAIGDSGEAGFLDIVRGVQWAVDNRERLNIRVLNLSFAAKPRWPYWEDPVNQALMRAWQAGIFIAAAAGNEGPDPMTVGSPGNLPYLLTVGAITDSWTEVEPNDDYIPDFSSRGPTPLGHIKPDLVAPGGHMAGLIRPGSALEKDFPEYKISTGEFVMTGTSQATALVSGLAALLLQIEPELSNDELKCMLRTSTNPAIEADGRLAYSPFAQGDGLVSVKRAITIGDRQCEQQSMDLPADILGRDHFQGPALFMENQAPSLPGQTQAISDRTSEKGMSDTRRWGAAAHLRRLIEPAPTDPFDWPAIYREEQRRIGELLSSEE
jgi:serine protease AprX